MDGSHKSSGHKRALFRRHVVSGAFAETSDNVVFLGGESILNIFLFRTFSGFLMNCFNKLGNQSAK